MDCRWNTDGSLTAPGRSTFFNRQSVAIGFRKLVVIGNLLGIGLVALAGVGVTTSSRSQAAPPTDAEAVPEQTRQLQTCREGILDPEARAEERRRWAELLLSYNSSESAVLVVELLCLAQYPDVQRALCGVIADRTRVAKARLEPAFVDPLVELLGAEAADLRALAAQALADFPGADVPTRLGQLASQSDVPLEKRLAAIDALAPNTHRREVVDQLVRLLDAKVPEITGRVVAVMEPLVRETFGHNATRWRSWWDSKKRLSEGAWLAEQLRIHRDRLRRVADELQQHRQKTRRIQDALTVRSRAFQRELYRAIQEEQRDAKLTEWLADPLPDVKRTALAIIKERMGDEGKRPTGNVLTSLLTLLEDGSAQMRQEVLEIAQNLNDPAVVDAVLGQLERETDPVTRLAVFKALGKFDSRDVVGVLIRELAVPESSTDCVREAAIALGRVAGKIDIAGHLPAAVMALNNRYDDVPVDQLSFRAALLAAMAGVADPSFASAFLGAVDCDDAAILREAIRGLRAIEDMSKLPRLRALTDHPDAVVRLEAIEAVAALGREEADLERLVPRLNPAIETNAPAREAAWRGFREFFSRRSMQERIRAAERLRDTPELEVKYLVELADSLSTTNADTLEQETVLDRLAVVLVGLSRHTEAANYLTALYDIQRRRSREEALISGVRLLDATLRGGTNLHVAELVRELAQGADDNLKAKIVETVATYLDSQQTAASAERRQALLDDLRTVPVEILGEDWARLLEPIAAPIESGDSETTPASPP